MSAVNPIDHPEQYESLVLAGERSPGVIRGLAPTLDHGWEKQEPKGSAGGETIHNGDKLVEFDVELYIWRDDKVDHFASWVAWRPILRRPVEKGASKALDIYHPTLDDLGVTSVVCKAEGALVPDGQGGATVKLKFLQYAPPKPAAAGKPAGSTSRQTTPGGGGGAPGEPGAEFGPPPPPGPDPNADLRAEVEAAEEQFRNPTGGV